MKPVKWPYHKDFAFTIVDDTDHATIERIEPIYNVLDSLNFKTTKTVWVNPSAAGTLFDKSHTLRNPNYLKLFVVFKHGDLKLRCTVSQVKAHQEKR